MAQEKKGQIAIEWKSGRSPDPDKAVVATALGIEGIHVDVRDDFLLIDLRLGSTDDPLSIFLDLRDKIDLTLIMEKLLQLRICRMMKQGLKIQDVAAVEGGIGAVQLLRMVHHRVSELELFFLNMKLAEKGIKPNVLRKMEAQVFQLSSSAGPIEIEQKLCADYEIGDWETMALLNRWILATLVIIHFPDTE